MAKKAKFGVSTAPRNKPKKRPGRQRPKVLTKVLASAPTRSAPALRRRRTPPPSPLPGALPSPMPTPTLPLNYCLQFLLVLLWTFRLLCLTTTTEPALT